jgi:hypothetical protein
MLMPAPTTDPNSRTDVPPADSYGPGARIWVHRGGTVWRPGCVESATPIAATVTYRPTEHRGTMVDTVTAVHLAPRTEDDPVDRAQPRPGKALPVRARTPDHDQDSACPGLGNSR